MQFVLSLRGAKRERADAAAAATPRKTPEIFALQMDRNEGETIAEQTKIKCGVINDLHQS